MDISEISEIESKQHSDLFERINTDRNIFNQMNKYLLLTFGEYPEFNCINYCKILDAFRAFNVEPFILIIAIYNFIKLSNIIPAHEKKMLLKDHIYFASCIISTIKYYKDVWVYSNSYIISYINCYMRTSYPLHFFNESEWSVNKVLNFQFRPLYKEIDDLMNNIWNLIPVY
jgi:hypothetical protein